MLHTPDQRGSTSAPRQELVAFRVSKDDVAIGIGDLGREASSQARVARPRICGDSPLPPRVLARRCVRSQVVSAWICERELAHSPWLVVYWRDGESSR